jgi:aryl-alcohol dehydrogenase-like predicted oxidoreductase
MPDSALFADAGLLAALAQLRPHRADDERAHQADTIRQALGLTVGGRQLFTVAQVTWNLLEPSVGPSAAEAASAGWAILVKEVLANGRLTATAGPQALVGALAAARGVTKDAIALANPWASVVLSGTVTPAQLTANLAALAIGDLPTLDLAETPSAYWAARAARPWH